MLTKLGWLSLFAVIIVFNSCTTHVNLIRPIPEDKLKITGATSPEFVWEIPHYDEKATYHLEVANDKLFRDVILSKENLKETAFQPGKDDTFFPGDAKYYWRVNGFQLNKYGEKEDTFPCKETRSFYIEERPTVRVLFKIPKPSAEGGLSVRIKDEEFTQDFIRDMEVGEWLNMTAVLTKGENIKEIGGRINVLMSNSSTKYGNIVVDCLTHEKLIHIMDGSVENRHFMLSGDKIVHVTLGSRTE